MKHTHILLIIAMLMASCKKDKAEDPPMVTVNPLNELASRGATSANADGAPGEYQVGVRFLVHKDGTMAKLGLRSPSAGTYRVQLYTFVAKDSAVLTYPLITEPERLGYADITISAADAAGGKPVMANISTVAIKKKDSDGAGKIRQYLVCFNDLDKTQYQQTLPSGVVMPMQFNNVLSLQQYNYNSTKNINTSTLNIISGGFTTVAFGDVRFEFVTPK